MPRSNLSLRLISNGRPNRMQFIQVRSDRPVNCFEYAMHVSVYVLVGEPEHAISQVIQVSIPRFVTNAVLIKAVLISIYFHDNARATTFEIDDVAGYRRLSTKMESQ